MTTKEFRNSELFLRNEFEKDGQWGFPIIKRQTINLDNQAPFKEYMWECSKASMKECAEEFLNSNIWDGKNFMQIQRDVTWKE